MSKRTKLTREIRFAAFERDNFTCRACGSHDPSGDSLQGDHIVPVTKGGQNTLSNLQTLCGVCNNAKQTVDLKLPKREAPSMTQSLGEYLNMVEENREVFRRTLATARTRQRIADHKKKKGA